MHRRICMTISLSQRSEMCTVMRSDHAQTVSMAISLSHRSEMCTVMRADHAHTVSMAISLSQRSESCTVMRADPSQRQFYNRKALTGVFSCYPCEHPSASEMSVRHITAHGGVAKLPP